MTIRGDKGKGKVVGESSRPRTKARTKRASNDNIGRGIILTTRDAQDNYTRYQQREVINSRFVSQTCCEKLGIWEDVSWLLTNIKLLDFMLTPTYAYVELTREFLSTFNHDVNRGKVHFQLVNQSTTMNLTEWHKALGLAPEGSADINLHVDYIPSHFWVEITGVDEEFNPKNAKASKVQHPAFRYILRVLAHTIFARDESDGNVRATELFLLWAMLHRQGPFLGMFIIDHIKEVQRGTGKICMGSIVTKLVPTVSGSTDVSQFTRAQGSLYDDLATCSSMRMIRKDGNRWWLRIKQGTETPFHLPHPNISVRNPDNWRVENIRDPDEVMQEAGADEEDEEDEDDDDENDYPPELYDQLSNIDTHLQEHTLQLEAMQQNQMQIRHDYAAIQREMLAFQTTQEQLLEAQQKANERQENMERMLKAMHDLHFPPPPP